MTDDDLRALLPTSKVDIDRANAVVARGYPAIAPIVPELLEWLKDYNWPVAQVLDDVDEAEDDRVAAEEGSEIADEDAAAVTDARAGRIP